jgi:pyrroline-5-carboxylate reductase
MADYGFIGYGSMGSMLVKQLINSGGVEQDNIIITRKKLEKLDEIRKEWPGINLAAEITEVVRNAKYLFICVKPLEYFDVLEEIKTVVSPKQHIICIAGSLEIRDMESILPCKITKLMPTLISEANEGITLLCHNGAVNEAEAAALEKVLEGFTKLKRVREDAFGFASEFTSCGPGFFAAILQEFVEAGYRYSDSFTREELTELTAWTVYGTAKLMLENRMDFKEVIERVATKGGITEEGVMVFRDDLPQVFEKMFDRTMGKRKAVEEKLHSQYTAKQ